MLLWWCMFILHFFGVTCHQVELEGPPFAQRFHCDKKADKIKQPISYSKGIDVMKMTIYIGIKFCA